MKNKHISFLIIFLIFTLINIKCTNEAERKLSVENIPKDSGQLSKPHLRKVSFHVLINGTIDTVIEFEIDKNHTLINNYEHSKDVLTIVNSETNEVIDYLNTSESIFIPLDTSIVAWRKISVNENTRIDTATTEIGKVIMPYSCAKIKIQADTFVLVQEKRIDIIYDLYKTEDDYILHMVKQFYKL